MVEPCTEQVVGHGNHTGDADRCNGVALESLESLAEQVWIGADQSYAKPLPRRGFGQ